MSGENPKITWEAHEVTTSTGYIKTLFHITGMTGYDEYYPHYQPVLIANGAATNAMSYLYDEYSFSIMTGVDYDTIKDALVAEYRAGNVPQSIHDRIKNDYPGVYKKLKQAIKDEFGDDIDLSTIDDD